MEIEVTSRSNTSIYEALGVPELWRFTRGNLQINVLRDGKYMESDRSDIFSNFSLTEVIPQYLERCKTIGRNKTMKAFRNWVKNK